ncbi:unnamed protein product [Cylindrotheca closterium]|uniref:Histone deacetylase n=1 Tax=Cylindrotheca closterium TaxID=2856 RepID=A0AAD2CL75_9STRA|nr:unnamed protein product [Cylindrotheca closterium]
MGKKRVSYFYDQEMPLVYFGSAHPMKPHRLKLTHHLILNYGLHKRLDCFNPKPADPGVMSEYFHDEEYVQFLRKITPDNGRQHAANIQRFNVGGTADCPVFEGLFEFNQITSGASIDGAVQLCLDMYDIAINWSGGFHHAHKAEAAGFCYINDIVLAIVELLKVHARVLYVDIDVHHGDGVEEAFYTSDRVMTFSLHKYGDFFPGTGSNREKGAKAGDGYSLNCPLNNGISDEKYFDQLFKPIFDKIMEVFQPSAIVLQCGADSLAADRLGTLNLTTKGHATMVQYVKSKSIPTLVLGGGGYTIRNVARVWCYETAVLVDKPDICDDIPYHDYYEYFAPTYKLHLKPENMTDLNSKSDIDNIRTDLLQQLKGLRGAPSVAMHQVPPLFHRMEEKDAEKDQEEDLHADVRPKKKRGRKSKKQHEAELYDGVD